MYSWNRFVTLPNTRLIDVTTSLLTWSHYHSNLVRSLQCQLSRRAVLFQVLCLLGTQRLGEG